MITIKKSDFDRLRREHPDYIGPAIYPHTFDGKTCHTGEWVAFECILTGDYSKGCHLLYEHIHFDIIPD